MAVEASGCACEFHTELRKERREARAMNADAQTTAEERAEWLQSFEYYNRGSKPATQRLRRLIAHVDALAAQNGALAAALRAEHLEIRLKAQVEHYESRCPVCALLAGQPVATEAERLRERARERRG